MSTKLNAENLLAALGDDAEALAAGARKFLDIGDEDGPSERPEGEEPRAQTTND